MKKSIYILIAAGMFIASGARAQSSFTTYYSMGFGTGDVNTYISAPSFRGFGMEYKNYIKPNLSIGIDVAWNVFYERKDYDTYTSGTLSVSGVQYRYINAVPIFVNTNYYFKPGGKIKPYVGLGIGTMSMNRKTEMNLYYISEDSWNFALKPEAGILFNANPEMDILIAGKYNYGFAANGMTAQSYFTLNLGLVWKRHLD